MKTRYTLLGLSAIALALQSCSPAPPCGEGAGNVLDEAMCAGRGAASLPSADEDFYADMDYGISKRPTELVQRLEPFIPGITEEQAVEAFAKGRNNWIVWTAGNDRLWDELSRASVGNLDLLKVVTNHPSLKFSRDNRWQYLGLVNEPCFVKGDEPRGDRWGLYLDERDIGCPVDPFENEEKYPGVKIGHRGEDIAAGPYRSNGVGSYYGYGTGIVGLRLFTNPNFDQKAADRWNPERYYTDPDYYNDKDLIKPYRVGMSCGFCHVGPNPTNPPTDPENPRWANLSSNPGAQYFWVDRILMFDPQPDNFASQLFHTSRPGALDTSLVSTDYINNPRTMNAVYSLGARVEIAARWGKERLAGGSRNNRQFNQVAEIPEDSVLNSFYDAPDTVLTPRVLKDGSDSVGALGALNRVFVNIGLFSEEWLEHFRPLIGGKEITPFEIAVARENSSYWQANEAQTPDLALFFLGSAEPDYLARAPGGEAYLDADEATLEQGKQVFAGTCARCHSSKLPEKAFEFFPDQGCVNNNYLQCFNEYWAWTKTDEFKQDMTEIVKSEQFLVNNFLSTELRIPVTLLETNACSPLATNAIRDNIWDNFSSESYKNLPSVGTVQVQHPYSGAVRNYAMPGGGRGFTRPASLISAWSTAPFLLNNTVGDFYWTGTVADRMASFDDSIEKMLWPQKREGSFTVVTRSGKEHPGVIDLTSEPSHLGVSAGFLPDFLKPLLGFGSRYLPWLFGESGVQIGPIPGGTPVNLVSNIDMEERKDALKLLLKAKKDLKQLSKDKAYQQAVEQGDIETQNTLARAVFKDLVDPLLEISKCPDYVVNKGHYFGTEYFQEGDETPLTDQEKQALIAYLKTF